MSRKVWLVSRRLAVRNGRRLPSRSWSFCPAIHTPGSTRTSVRFSSESRNGPGRIASVAFAGRQLDGIDDRLVDDLLEVLGQVDSRAPEDLAVIFPHRQRMGIVRRDPANARVHREGYFDHLVERGFVADGAQCAGVLVAVDGLERGTGVEHAAAAGTEYVPGQVEQADAGRMQERGDRPLFIEPASRREIEPLTRLSAGSGASRTSA